MTEGFPSPLASALPTDRFGVATVRMSARLAILGVLLLSSGNPAVTWHFAPKAPLVIAALLLAGLLALHGRLVPDVASSLAFAAFGVLLAIQLATVPGAGLLSSIGFVVLLFIAYATMRTTHAAPRIVVLATTMLAALALLIYAVQHIFWSIGSDLVRLLSPMSVVRDEHDTVNIVIQNFNSELHHHRNAGVFWEPGALSGYALFAMVLLGLGAQQFSRREFWSCVVVLGVAILTTLSTTGYLLLPAVLGYYALLRQPPRRSHRGRTMLIATLAVVFASGGVASLYRLEFVGEKIREQLEISMGETETYWQVTRFGTLISDLTDIAQRPIAGWGANPLIRPSVKYEDEVIQNSQGNGLSGFVARFGIAGMGTYCVLSLLGLRRYGATTWTRASLALLLVLVTLFSEPFLNYPLFLSLMFLPAYQRLGRKVWVVPAGRADAVQRVGAT